jgi:signal transduction histidine kinase
MPSQKGSKEIILNKFFTDVNKSVIKSIFKTDSFKEVNEGEIIYKVGEDSKELFLLLRGEVKLKFPSQNYISNKIFNDFFGEKELFDNTRRNSFAVANNKCLLYIIQKQEFEILLSKSNTIKMNIETFGEIKIPEVTTSDKGRVDLTKSVKPRLFRAIYSRDEETKTDHKYQNKVNDLTGLSDENVQIEDASVELENEIIMDEGEVEAAKTKPEDQRKRFEEISSSLKGKEHQKQEQIDLTDTQKLLDLFSSFNKHFKIYETIQSIVEELLKLTSSEAGDIYLIDKQRGKLKIILDENGSRSFVKFKNSEGLTGECALQGKTINLENPDQDIRFVADIDQLSSELDKIIFIPLLGQGNETVGVLQLARRQKEYSINDIEQLELVIRHAALAIERVNSIEKMIELEKQESIDGIENFLKENLLIPINVINSYTSHLNKDSFSKKIREMIDLIENQTNFIWDIFLSVFCYNKKEFKLNTEQVNINDYMNSIVELLSDYCRSRNINLFKKTGDDEDVIIDFGKFFMAIFQLVENACNVSEEGGKVFISSFTDKDYIQINVMDVGTGVPDELKESIFIPGFSKSKGRNRFGLPIAKRIVDLHSGDLSFSSNAKVGSTFTIKIPVLKNAVEPQLDNASNSNSTSEELKTD